MSENSGVRLHKFHCIFTMYQMNINCFYNVEQQSKSCSITFNLILNVEMDSLLCSSISFLTRITFLVQVQVLGKVHNFAIFLCSFEFLGISPSDNDININEFIVHLKNKIQYSWNGFFSTGQNRLDPLRKYFWNV
jgi:hypothetical protein